MPDISSRKADHVRLAGDPRSGGSDAGVFGDVTLVHSALPEIDLAAVDTGIDFLGRHLRLPLCIASMTGGYAGGGEINAILARTAERHGLAMGVGSQRAALRDPSLRDSYAVVRREAPNATLYANVGAAQLVRQGATPGLTVAEVRALAEMIGADAVIVHLNAVQELIQPEGDRNAAGWTDAIARLAADLGLPVIVKETGGGMSEMTARAIAGTGAAAIDVGGRGGTSFAMIEGLRAAEQGDERGARLGTLLADWGIPTAASVVVAARAGLPIIATGGVRSGLDAARAIAIGATAVGVARPLLQAAIDEGDDGAAAWVDRFGDEFASAMFLAGAASIDALQAAPVVVLGETRGWVDALGLTGSGQRP